MPLSERQASAFLLLCFDDGVTFNLEAHVDAVQTHNAQDAIKSAWGVNVNVSSDGTLSL